jgi:hypothetical protein
MLISSLKEAVMARLRHPIRIQAGTLLEMANRIEVAAEVQREELMVVVKPQTTEAKELKAS